MNNDKAGQDEFKKLLDIKMKEQTFDPKKEGWQPIPKDNQEEKD